MLRRKGKLSYFRRSVNRVKLMFSPLLTRFSTFFSAVTSPFAGLFKQERHPSGGDSHEEVLVDDFDGQCCRTYPYNHSRIQRWQREKRKRKAAAEAGEAATAAALVKREKGAAAASAAGSESSASGGDRGAGGGSEAAKAAVPAKAAKTQEAAGKFSYFQN